MLTGILPTIRKGDLSLDNMVQNPRYLALNDALTEPAVQAYELHIKGMDELIVVRQDSVMAEACNAQLPGSSAGQTADEFVNMYNVSQLLAGPVPRVRNELTCALRQAAVGRDSHRAVRAIGRHPPPRPPHPRPQCLVTFGTDWVHESNRRALQGDIARFRPVPRRTLVGCRSSTGRGRVPPLRCLADAHGRGLALEPRLLQHH